MRSHELWCASVYRAVDGTPYACDCGAEREVAEHLAPFAPFGLKKAKQRITWSGNLPDQFCVRCEQAPVKKVIITPAGSKRPRLFAACLNNECAHIREIAD